MKKILIITLASFFVLSLFSGCVDQYERELSITWSNTDLSIDKGTDLIIKIHGKGNNISIDKMVSLDLIEFGYYSVNNTVWIYGHPKTNVTSTWDLHNCSLTGVSSEYRNIIRYKGD